MKVCPEPEKPNTDTPETPNTAGGGRIGIYCGLGLTAAVVVVLVVCCILFIHCHSDEQHFCLAFSGGSELDKQNSMKQFYMTDRSDQGTKEERGEFQDGSVLIKL